jgi:hypothetical protein
MLIGIRQEEQSFKEEQVLQIFSCLTSEMLELQKICYLFRMVQDMG